MGRWDEREKAFDGDTPEEIIEDFEVAKVMMDCFQCKKEQFKIGLDLISEGKRIDEQLDFWESKLGKLCRENYQLLKSKGKDVDEIMDFFSERTRDTLK
ncbi:hypothetical protein OAJ88_03490 [Candidatus Nitrosopelagicus sp.]|nr:hypothetical protein [Candidatus Nitrosopelagicus sp.]